MSDFATESNESIPDRRQRQVLAPEFFDGSRGSDLCESEEQQCQVEDSPVSDGWSEGLPGDSGVDIVGEPVQGHSEPSKADEGVLVDSGSDGGQEDAVFEDGWDVEQDSVSADVGLYSVDQLTQEVEANASTTDELQADYGTAIDALLGDGATGPGGGPMVMDGWDEEVPGDSGVDIVGDPVQDELAHEFLSSSHAVDAQAVCDLVGFDPSHTKTEVGSAFFVAGDSILDTIDQVPNYPGEYVLDLHGSPVSVSVPDSDGSIHELNAAEFATVVKSATDWSGEPIRLFSCSTGERPDGFAQELANELGVEVIAPTDPVSPNPLGRDYPAVIAKSGPTKVFGGLIYAPGEAGEWKSFKPKGDGS